MEAIEQQHPFQTPGITHQILPHTLVHGIIDLTQHRVQALVAHIPTLRQEPEQHQDMVVPEEDKDQRWKSNIGCRFFRHFLRKKKSATCL